MGDSTRENKISSYAKEYSIEKEDVKFLYEVEVKNEILAEKIGFDVPISLEKENTLLIGKKDKFFKIKRRFKFDILIVYPNIICKTKKIFKKNRVSNFSKKYSFSIIRDKKKLINLLISENNDLEETIGIDSDLERK